MLQETGTEGLPKISKYSTPAAEAYRAALKVGGAPYRSNSNDPGGKRNATTRMMTGKILIDSDKNSPPPHTITHTKNWRKLTEPTVF
eukprot:1047704-Amphidinium_carterae.1